VSWFSQVSATAFQGLEITVVGMALVFFTLGLVIVSLVLLTRLPGLRAREQEPAQESPGPLIEPAAKPGSAPVAAPDDELAQVAAIAVSLLQSQRRVSPRPQAQATRNAWKSYGRAHQLGL
jgi:Na+-transporting methylmalonyl-CoA/oxaloacetate decarboxylase gamma subunit